MSSEGSVTHWIRELKTDQEGIAQQELWNRYFRRLVTLARKKLGVLPRRVEDEEDATLSAFESFFRGVRRGQFPQLRDRHNLWPLLVKITARKVLNQRRLARAQKRGSGKVAGESGFAPRHDQARGIEQVVGTTPSPEFSLTFADELRHRLAALPNDSLRTVATMRLEGYGTGEIADRLGVMEDTVRRKLRRIRKLWSQEPE